MKKITLLLAFCLTVVLAKATVYLDEKFPQFPASTDLGFAVNGWSNWASNIVAATDNRTVVSPPLQYSDAGGLPVLSSVGNSLYNNYTGLSGNAYLSSKSFSDNPVSTGTIYMSFLFQAIKQGGSQGEIIGLTDSIQRSALKVWIGKGADATTFKLGLTRSSGSSADIQYVPGKAYSYGTTYFLVYKYDFATAKAFLYVNPLVGSASEPVADVIDSIKGTARKALQYVICSNKGSNKAYYYASGVRVCSAWSEAVEAYKSELPKLATPSVSAASAINTESFVANWTPVANAASYAVFVYNGSTLCYKVPVADPSASSALITGLVSNTAYTYKVEAIGDNVSYASSEVSAASSPVTTLTGSLTITTDFSDGSWGTVYPSSADEPASGSFPSFVTAGGYEVVKGLCSGGSKTGPLGEVHANSLKLDKGSYGSMLLIPSMMSVGRVEIHAWTGTAVRPFALQELLPTGWSAVETFTTGATANVDSIFVSNMVRTGGCKLRIVNTGGGGLNIGLVTVYENGLSAINQAVSSFRILANGATVYTSEPGVLTLFNLQGMRVLQATVQSNIATGLPAGVYIARLTNQSGKSITRKLILK